MLKGVVPKLPRLDDQVDFFKNCISQRQARQQLECCGCVPLAQCPKYVAAALILELLINVVLSLWALSLLNIILIPIIIFTSIQKNFRLMYRVYALVSVLTAIPIFMECLEGAEFRVGLFVLQLIYLIVFKTHFALAIRQHDIQET